jgi:hypothetical protein
MVARRGLDCISNVCMYVGVDIWCSPYCLLQIRSRRERIVMSFDESNEQNLCTTLWLRVLMSLVSSELSSAIAIG